MTTLDVASFFENIYTHSISWVRIGRDLGKKWRQKDGVFLNKLDRLLQKINNLETKVIIVGPEFCRIVSEILLQHIDSIVMKDDNLRHWLSLREAFIQRYMDDIFIFSNSIEKNRFIRDRYADALSEMRLALNPFKETEQRRPFQPYKSNSKIQVERFASFLSERKNNFFTKKKVDFYLCKRLRMFFSNNTSIISEVTPNLFSAIIQYLRSINETFLGANEDETDIAEFSIRSQIDNNPFDSSLGFSICHEIQEIIRLAFYLFSIDQNYTTLNKIFILFFDLSEFLKKTPPYLSLQVGNTISVELNIALKVVEKMQSSKTFERIEIINLITLSYIYFDAFELNNSNETFQLVEDSLKIKDKNGAPKSFSFFCLLSIFEKIEEGNLKEENIYRNLLDDALEKIFNGWMPNKIRGDLVDSRRNADVFLKFCILLNSKIVEDDLRIEIFCGLFQNEQVSLRGIKRDDILKEVKSYTSFCFSEKKFIARLVRNRPFQRSYG